MRGSKVHLRSRKAALGPGQQGTRGRQARDALRAMGPHGDFGLSPQILGKLVAAVWGVTGRGWSSPSWMLS